MGMRLQHVLCAPGQGWVAVPPLTTVTLCTILLPWYHILTLQSGGLCLNPNSTLPFFSTSTRIIHAHNFNLKNCIGKKTLSEK